MPKLKNSIVINIVSLPHINTKERKKTIIDFPIIVGVYKITSPSGKIYIGLTTDAYVRLYSYKGLKCKAQIKLYNSLKKHGVENHKFEVIHICKEEELNYWEEYYGKLFNVTDNLCGLNIRECGGSNGKLNKQTKEILRNINLGKKYSSEVNKKKGRKGHKPPTRYRKDYTEEELKIRSEKWSGKNNPNFGNKNMTPEHKQKLLEANLGKKQSEEQKKQTSKRFKGIPITQDHKDKISKGNKGKKKSPEHIRKSAESRKGLKRSDEYKKAKSENMKGKMSGEKHPRYGKKQSKEEISKRVETRKRNKEEKIKNGTFEKRVVSDEFRKKQSEAKKGKPMHENAKNALLKANTGRKQNAETKAKRQETRKRNREANPNIGYGRGKKKSPEHIKNVVEAKKRIRQERLTMIF